MQEGGDGEFDDQPVDTHHTARSLELLQSVFNHIGHDMRGPLAALYSNVGYLKDLLEHDILRIKADSSEKAEVTATLEDMVESLQRLRHIAGYFDAAPQGSTHLIASVAQIVERLSKTESRLEILSVPEEPIHVLFPGTILSAILHELAVNAVRHGKARRIGISWKRQGNTLVLNVADDGTGFAQMQGDRAQPHDLFDSRTGGLLYWERTLLRSGGLALVSRSVEMGGAQISLHIPGVVGS